MSSAWMTACGSGASVNTVGMPISVATAAAAMEPTSAIRRWTTSTPAVRGQGPSDPALRGHGQWPGIGGIRRLGHQRDRRQHMAGRRVGQRIDRCTDGPSRHRQDAGDSGLGGQGVTEPHQHRRDAAVVAGAGPAQFPVQVGMQEELRHHQSRLMDRFPGDGLSREASTNTELFGIRHSAAWFTDRQIERGQPSDTGEFAAGLFEAPEQFAGCPVVGPVPECGHGRHPGADRFAFIGGDPPQRAGSHRAGDQAHGFHQPGPAGRVIQGEQRAFQRQRNVVRRRLRPAAQRALVDHGGEAARRDAGDQPADGIQSRGTRPERPCRMFPQVELGIGQQVGQDSPGSVVEHRPECVHRSNGDQLVVGLTDRRGQQLDGVRTAIMVGRGGEGVRRADGVQQKGCVANLRERGLHGHGVSFRYGGNVFNADTSRFEGVPPLRSVNRLQPRTRLAPGDSALVGRVSAGAETRPGAADEVPEPGAPRMHPSERVHREPKHRGTRAPGVGSVPPVGQHDPSRTRARQLSANDGSAEM